MTAELTKGHMATLMTSVPIGIGSFYGTTAVPGTALVLRVAGIVVLIGLLGWTSSIGRRGRQLPATGGRGSSPFGRTYGIAVLLMLVAIFAGSRVLTAVLGMPEATGTWAWAAVTGFGGAVVLWSAVVATLLDGSAQITRQVGLSLN